MRTADEVGRVVGRRDDDPGGVDRARPAVDRDRRRHGAVGDVVVPAVVVGERRRRACRRRRRDTPCPPRREPAGVVGAQLAEVHRLAEEVPVSNAVPEPGVPPARSYARPGRWRAAPRSATVDDGVAPQDGDGVGGRLPPGCRARSGTRTTRPCGWRGGPSTRSRRRPAVSSATTCAGGIVAVDAEARSLALQRARARPCRSPGGIGAGSVNLGAEIDSPSWLLPTRAMPMAGWMAARTIVRSVSRYASGSGIAHRCDTEQQLELTGWVTVTLVQRRCATTRANEPAGDRRANVCPPVAPARARRGYVRAAACGARW